jgi:glutathione synthase/RimK-type ligase-like ATP-grasp enzyme
MTILIASELNGAPVMGEAGASINMTAHCDYVQQTEQIVSGTSTVEKQLDSKDNLTVISDDSSELSSVGTSPICSIDATPAVLTAEELALLEDITTPVPCNVTQPGFVPILEARGGVDKGANGLRNDTMPIALGIASTNQCRTAIYQFLEEEVSGSLDTNVNQLAIQSNEALKKLCLTQASAVVVRVNPGTLTPYTQTRVDNILRDLHRAGIQVMIHPDVQLGMGAKDALYKIRHLKCGLLDTEVYYTPDDFRAGFRKTIAFRPRVIKQNRGSMGEGVWICKLKDESKYCSKYGDAIVDLDEELVLVEANDNHIEYHSVGEFMEFCLNGRSEKSGKWKSQGRGKYLEGGREVGAMLVDQRFLPRIVEGEVRCNLVGSKLVELVHKKPQDGCYSATLLSGAQYTVHSPEDPKFTNLVQALQEDLPKIMNAVGLEEHPLPLLWSVDYIFGEKDSQGNDTFHVGEFNSTCVGITKQPKLCELVGLTAVERALGCTL